MKKIFFGITALVAMLATSCQQDLGLVANGGETVNVSFNLATPQIASRAEFSDGMTATHLQYAVYDAQGNILSDLARTNDVIQGGSKVVDFQLTTGNTYTVLFWAAAPNAPYTVDLAAKTMEVSYDNAVSSDETRDAFYFYSEPFTVTSGMAPISAELRRPFAQLNIGTNDYAASTSAHYTVTAAKVTTYAYKTLNFATGAVSGKDMVHFGFAPIPTDQVFPVQGYEYMAMNYLLMAETQETIDVVFTYTDGTTEKQRIVGAVPVERNHRTNLYGQLLTSDFKVNVEIKPEYAGTHEAEALQMAATFGGEVTLTEDVVLEQGLNVTADMTINLNGHNITIAAAYNDANVTASSAISNNAIMTLTGNGEIKAENNYTVRNYGTMIIDGVTIKNGVMNFGDLTVNSGNISNSRSGKHTIYGNAATLTINGGTFHNENAGNASIFSYAGEVVINGGEFTIADGTATFGWTSCLLDAQGSAKYTINGGVIKGEIRDYNKNTTVYGGTFTHSSVKNFLAAGYKAIEVDGSYHVLPEVVADAATAAGVTAVTESTADVASALAANNGEAALFMWEDVAYIAKYGEVVITSSAEEATTVRGVVESAAGLKTATVSEGIEVVGNRTFRKCANLETVALPNTLTEIGPAVFQSCSKLSNVNIPASVTTIGEGAFADCVALTSINIPNGVTRLEKDVLRNTGLTSIEIPASVNYIGTYAFRDCESLTEVKILSPEFTIEVNSFTNMAAPVPTMTIYVVNAEMKAYLDSVLTNYDKSYITVVVM